jgi:Uma2 family endonuclease
MIVQTQETRIYSPEEYFELEIPAEERHEYINGEIRVMPGRTPNHNRIVGNLYANLNFALRGQSYEVFITDQRVWIPRRRIYTYPDIIIIDGALQYQEGRKDTLLNPSIIIEVLSKSTSSYDRSDKFSAYRTIPEFREYILIDQYQIYVEHYVKTEPRKWTFQEYDESNGRLTFSSLAFEISLTDLYHKVEFEPEEREIS